ncbi:MAG: hypothetical protein HY851_05070 [candidate division Zixibacteria bacterium]|nr:hypothetical protein [candidate division Zixibacteria bacterium]
MVRDAREEAEKDSSKKQRLPPETVDTSAIFVVHGMGEQRPTETAATLRSGFDDQHFDRADREFILPPPYIRDGYWGNYTDLEKTFEEEWKRFGPGQKEFFGELWQARTNSRFQVFRWGLGQLGRLVNPRVILDLGPTAWFLYLPYQVLGTGTLIVSLVKAPRLLTGFLGDVRVYVDPSGVTERAIAQRIDARVAATFMRMIGMDANFNSLDVDKWNKSSGRPVCFDRVVWVAHSLGSVISYNVLSDLFDKAETIEKNFLEKSPNNDGQIKEQYENVQLFRQRLHRFVTIGSPLDKVAYLYGNRAVSPWPGKTRASLLGDDEKPWWVNFYSVFDPVSGPLNAKFLFGTTPPANFHALSSVWPGYAHVCYWRDKTVLRYILGKTYGERVLTDKLPKPWPVWSVTLLALVFHALIFVIAALALIVALWWVAHTLEVYNHSLIDWLKCIFGWLARLIGIEIGAPE